MNTRQPKRVTTLGTIWGQSIRARRERIGLTQVQVAELAGISQPSIAQFEAGKFIPADRSKVALARALGTTPGELFPWPPMEDLVSDAA